MKLRAKLFYSFIIIAGISAVLATFTAIYSVSQKFQDLAGEEMLTARKSAENFFYENMGELTRQAMFLAELSDIIAHIDNPDELYLSLDSKNLFLYNINVAVIDAQNRMVLNYNNAPHSHITKSNFLKLPFFKEGKDPMLRDAGIFKLRNHLVIFLITPLIDQQSFSLKGFLLLELCLNAEFADQLKEKARGEIIIRTPEKQLASTFQDAEGKRYFPGFSFDAEDSGREYNIQGTHYLIDRFPVSDYFEKKAGEILVAVDISGTLEAKKQGIRGLLLVLAVVVVLVVILSLYLGQKLTHPLQQLAGGAEAISSGDFDVRISYGSRDEMGQLAGTFNKMAESLATQRKENVALKLFFEKVVQNSPSAIIICDLVTHAININPAAEKLFGVSAEDLVGKEIFEVVSLPLSLQADYYQVILSGNSISHDCYRLSLPQDEEKIFRITFYEVAVEDRNSVVIQIEDITESLHLEEELTHAQKLGTLGEVLGRFTHEFNNLMTGIVGNIALLKKKSDPGTKEFQRINSIEDLSLKAQKLGKNILSFSKKEKFEIERTDVTAVIDSVLELTEKTVFKDISIQRLYAPEPLYTMANKEKLSLALLNLLINSKDALKSCDLEEWIISIGSEATPVDRSGKGYVKISITDNGCGIEPKALKRIFEPFFTTKGKKGTGLGLATVKEIVEKSNGSIYVESVTNRGTTFTIQFPTILEEEGEVSSR